MPPEGPIKSGGHRMARTIDLDPRGKDLVIRFPYDPRVIPVVRSLPGRRWNARDKVWTVSSSSIRETVKALEPFGFLLSPEARGILDGSSSSKGQLGTSPEQESLFAATEVDEEKNGITGANLRAEVATVTVSQLNLRVRSALLDAFPQDLWVSGEILEWDRNSHKRTVYFKIAEREENQARPKAAVTAVLFESRKELLEQRLASSQQPIRLADGVEVRLLVRVDLYPPSGGYQLIVEDIDPIFTLGKMAQNRARILQELDQRNLRERNLNRQIPRLPLRVALITSSGSDAYNDVVNELERSGYRFEVDVFDAHMQGPKLPKTLGLALDRAFADAGRYDAVVLVRGGGSRSDLAWFDNLDLAVRIAEAPLKVLCGIGHHRDVSILDLITTSRKTPTAVGALLVSQVRAAEEALETKGQALATAASRQMEEFKRHLADTVNRLSRESRRTLSWEGQRLTKTLRSVVDSSGRSLVRAHTSTLDRFHRIVRSCSQTLKEARKTSNTQRERLDWERLRPRIHRERTRIDGLARSLLQGTGVVLRAGNQRIESLALRVQARDPERLLRQGFCLLIDDSGKIVHTARNLTREQAVTVKLQDGEAEAKIESVHIHSQNPTPPSDTKRKN